MSRDQAAAFGAEQTAYRSVLTLREARRLVSACESHGLDQDELVEIWRSETGALNAEALLMSVQVSGADERFEVAE